MLPAGVIVGVAGIEIGTVLLPLPEQLPLVTVTPS